jgi:hypothetical protein
MMHRFLHRILDLTNLNPIGLNITIRRFESFRCGADFAHLFTKQGRNFNAFAEPATRERGRESGRAPELASTQTFTGMHALTVTPYYERRIHRPTVVYIHLIFFNMIIINVVVGAPSCRRMTCELWGDLFVLYNV